MNIYGYVYETKNLVNGKFYIGQKSGLFNRNYLGSGSVLKKAVKKYGVKTFNVFPICWGLTKNHLNELEIFEIEKYKKNYPGMLYNVTRGGEGFTGRHSEETIKKIKQRPDLIELGRKLGLSHIGSKRSEEAKRKTSKSLMGHITSEETKNKISLANKGKIRTDQMKMKLSESHMGISHSLSDEAKRKMSLARIGKHPTEETRQRLRLSHMGHFASQETRKKMSLAQINRWANKKWREQ